MKHRRYLLPVLAPAALLLATLFSLPGDQTPAVVYGAEAIPGRYIVVLDENIDSGMAAHAFGLAVGLDPDVVYRDAFSGFAAEMTPAEAAEVAASDYVHSVIADQRVSTALHQNNFQTMPTGIDRIGADENATASITTGGPDLDIDVAVIDTGVASGHTDLNVAGGASLACTGFTSEDESGHGTHVAGTIAAIDDDRGVVGVAPGARIWAVRVLDANGNGSNSCVIAGLDWVTGRRLEYNDGPADGDPGINIRVANLSLGGATGLPPGSDPMCSAVNSAVNAGVMVAVAAGNNAMDSSAYSPAHCTNAVTVSAYGDFDGQHGAQSNLFAVHSNCPIGNQTIPDDTFACFSNWGAPVDIAAPGVAISSTVSTQSCPSCYADMSGTSMATPHVSGALLILALGGYNGSAAGPAVMTALAAAGYTRAQNGPCGFSGDRAGDPAEPVLYLGSGCGAAATPSPPPTPSPTLSPSPPPTPSPSPTLTPSPSPTPAPSPSPTPTPSPTPSPSPPPIPSPSPTRTPSPSPTSTPSPSPTPPGVLGDANCDLAVTTVDSISALYIAGRLTLAASTCPGLADTNCNGHVDAEDALRILVHVSNGTNAPMACP